MQKDAKTKYRPKERPKDVVKAAVVCACYDKLMPKVDPGDIAKMKEICESFDEAAELRDILKKDCESLSLENIKDIIETLLK